MALLPRMLGVPHVTWSAMADLVPIPLALFDHLRRVGLDVDAVLARAKLARWRFNVAKPQGTRRSRSRLA